MNVLYIATYEGLSGASYSLVGLIIEMRKLGVNPFVVLLKHGAIERLLKENDIKYSVVRGYPWVIDNKKSSKLKQKLYWYIKKNINLIAERKICRFIKSNNIQILHINAFTASVGCNAAKKMKIPLVWHIREFVEEDLNKKFWNKKKSLKKLETADCVIAISDSVKNKFKNLSPDSKISVVYNGILNPDFSKERERKLFSSPKIELVIAGRIDPGKGHEEVIYAIKKVLDKGIKNITLKIVGKSQSKEYYEKIVDLVNKNNLSDYIDFCGYRDDISYIFRNTDIVIVASKAEAFGRVTAEAMLAGALVIGADTGGTKELVGTEYGLLYSQGNIDELSEQIIYAIKNSEKMKIIAQNGCQYAKENFTAKKNAQSIFSMYKILNKD